jgi:hypothetical protein
MRSFKFAVEKAVMVTKNQFTEFAKELGWTEADAKRAYEESDMNFKLVAQDDKSTLVLALAKFAGENLYKRQCEQAAQKGLVTKRNKEIKQIKLEYSTKIQQIEDALTTERSLLVTIIDRLYKFGRRFGLKDPWIEAFLTLYQENITYNKEILDKLDDLTKDDDSQQAG